MVFTISLNFCYSCYGYQTIRFRCANSVVSDHLFVNADQHFDDRFSVNSDKSDQFRELLSHLPERKKEFRRDFSLAVPAEAFSALHVIPY